MNPLWLVRNSINALKRCASIADAVRYLKWLYTKPVAGHEPPVWHINFRYSKPFEDFSLDLRSNGGSDVFIFGEVFDHQYYGLALPQAPKTILDLGANIGLTGIFFSRLYPDASIACVEPMTSNLAVMRRNLEQNNANATVFAAAVDVVDGEVTMEVHPHDYGHKVLSAGATAAKVTRIEAVSVSTIMKRMNWQRINLMKIDIEGHEAVLFSRNCDWLNLVDAMLIECHDGFFSGDDLAVLAAKYGFNPPQLRPGIWLVTRPA